MTSPNANPTVSIAMCTYNAGRFIREQLNSFAVQSVLPTELVIQDDASTDDTERIVAEFASKVSFPVRFQRNEARLGPTGNFERALGRCNSDVVFMSDADDVWIQNKIELTASEFRRTPRVNCVFSDATLVDESLTPRGLSLWESISFAEADRTAVLRGQLTDAFFRRTIGFGGVMAIRRSILEIALPIPRPWGHDNWTAIIAAALGKVAFIDTPLILYRQHGSQYSGGSTKSWVTRVKSASEPKVRRDWIPTGTSYVELEKRLLAFRNHAESQRVVSAAISDARAKAAHQLMRERLPSGLSSRVAPVLVDLLALRYRRFSNGILSAVRDIAFGSR